MAIVSWGLAAAWAAAILAASALVRPPVARRPPDRSPTFVRSRRRGGRRIAVAMVLVVAAVVDVRLGVAGLVAVGAAPTLRRRSERRRHHAAVVRELPEVIDLLRLSLGGGGSMLTAVRGLAGASLGPITTGLTEVSRQVEGGVRLADALELLVERTGPPVRPLVRALVGAEHYGTELMPTLMRLGDEARQDRLRRALGEARRVPIRLLMPLVACILPAFVLLTLVPTLAGTLDGLGG